jgi:HSP20 family protein
MVMGSSRYPWAIAPDRRIIMTMFLQRREHPFEQLRRELDRTFKAFGSGAWDSWNERDWPGVYPTVNIYDDGESFMVRAELPGVKKEELEVSAKADQLVLKGTRAVESAGEEAGYHRRERESGTFRRVIVLPQAVDASKVVASYKEGVLEIVLPRAEQAMLRRVTIS